MPWELTGNKGTNPPRDFLGTFGDNPAQPLVIKTAGAERLRVDTSGKVGIGTGSPAAKLHVLADGNSDWGIHIQNTPADDTTAGLSALKLVNRHTGGQDKTWALYTAAVGGGFGVQPNAF